MHIANDWKEYRILDTGNGEKLEQWGGYTLRRPDPQVIWPWQKNKELSDNADGIYHRSSKGGGKWDFRTNLPDSWTISYKGLRFKVKPTGFKHTGLFPEQAINWDWMREIISQDTKETKILNLFAYTGGATVACAKAGASICHVDSSKGMVTWAKENIGLSELSDRPVRFIVEDCIKFVEREIRRKNKYHGIIMDPPSFGRGPKGEMWKIEEQLYELIKKCTELLDEKALFMLINSYTAGYSSAVTGNILDMVVGEKFGGIIENGEIGLNAGKNIILPCGIYSRWTR